MMNKCTGMIGLSGLLLATACGEAASPAETGDGAEVATSELGAKSCAYSELFVTMGLIDDLGRSIDSKFGGPSGVNIPGSVSGFVSYGGDMINTIVGASASAERVFDVNPGGPFHGVVGAPVAVAAGGGTARTAKLAHAAESLFAAMTHAAEKTSIDDPAPGWKTVSRATPKGRVVCTREFDPKGKENSVECRFNGLLTFRVEDGAGAPCPIK